MNATELQTLVLRKNRFDQWYYYILLVALLCLGIGALVMGIRKSEPLLYAASAILIGLGVLGLNKLRKRYQVITITSRQSPEQIKKAVYEVLEEFGAPVRLLSDQPLTCTYSKGFLASSYRIHVCYDANGVYFSVQGQGSGGFIDFGGTQRVRNKLADAIELRLLYVS